jgi:hypothetical protein
VIVSRPRTSTSSLLLQNNAENKADTRTSCLDSRKPSHPFPAQSLSDHRFPFRLPTSEVCSFYCNVPCTPIHPVAGELSHNTLALHHPAPLYSTVQYFPRSPLANPNPATPDPHLQSLSVLGSTRSRRSDRLEHKALFSINTAISYLRTWNRGPLQRCYL